MPTEITVGIAGAAGDGLDRVGDTLARAAARLGLSVFTYNSYQSLIRGGHTWLRLRIGEKPVTNHGDRLDVLIALNQDSIERHAPEVEPGGAVLFNSKLECDPDLLRKRVRAVPLPVAEMTKDLGRLPPVMQNTAALGALLHLAGLDIEVAAEILHETFRHKGEEVIKQNVGTLRAGYEHSVASETPLGFKWKFTRTRRPVVTGNQMIALGAAAAGCKLYSAYPMSPASSILHWLASHSEKTGVVVKQAEDELAVVNMAIGAGHAGVRAMCATSGGGFALMTEAIGMAGMIEAPVVVVNVMRGGPSTGLPTKTEQGDLNQAFGASQGDFPRVIVAPRDAKDCFDATVEAFNLAEEFQLPVILLSDLYLAEHRSTMDAGAVSHDVEIRRGEWATETGNGRFHRFRITKSGVSPRARPGTPDLMFIAGTDDHDERGILISDEHTNAAIRRKMHEKRMRKMDEVLKRLPAPKLVGPKKAKATLIGWGSTWGVLEEAADRLAEEGIPTNLLHVKYLYPFHAKKVRDILAKCKTTIVVEANFTGQLARHLRAEAGIDARHVVTRYDGEPLDPSYVVHRVKECLAGRTHDLKVKEDEAREMAYHFIRIHLHDEARPGRVVKREKGDHGEPVFEVDLVSRKGKEPRGRLVIGRKTGAVHAYEEQGA
ncbi:MAG TPA: 2-oxoacid:acceptor oxidoreductase subunit alpha [Planctomycetota bacterium]|nr:2-oxoacid:acceptor oxidoreductase subunit alpha [Planctomycetota bacterium]